MGQMILRGQKPGAVFLLAALAGMINPAAVFAGGAATMKKQQAAQKQQMMQQQMVREKIRQEQLVRQQMVVARSEKLRTLNLPAEQVGVAAEADFHDVITALEQSSRPWLLIIDYNAKEAVVNHFIRRFQEQRIALRKPAWEYVDIIDTMCQQSPEMIDQPFSRVMQVVAVLEYDFDNGQNKDAMALKILGSKEAVIQNRQRLGMP